MKMGEARSLKNVIIITLLRGSTGVLRKKRERAAARSLKSVILEEENGLRPIITLLSGSTGVLRKKIGFAQSIYYSYNFQL